MVSRASASSIMFFNFLPSATTKWCSSGASPRIFFFIMNAKDVEVQWGDVKRNLTKAIFEIRMGGSLELDPPDPVTKKCKLDDYNFIKRWYYRNVMRKALNYHKAYWFNKLYELQEAMKKFLKENSF